MAPVYAYMLSWVLGGVVLAGDLLLARRATRAADERRSVVWPLLAAMGAVGFGGVGLTLEATSLTTPTVRPLLAVFAGLAMLGLSALLGRLPRRSELREPVA